MIYAVVTNNVVSLRSQLPLVASFVLQSSTMQNNYRNLERKKNNSSRRRKKVQGKKCPRPQLASSTPPMENKITQSYKQSQALSRAQLHILLNNVEEVSKSTKQKEKMEEKQSMFLKKS